ncbi:MAG: N-acetyl-gamma-glutamyl-phosphate reductase [Planctomycetota bacterium]
MSASPPNPPSAPEDAVRVAIVGPTGFTGAILVERLFRHPAANVTYLASHRQELPDLRDEFPRLTGLLDDDVAQCRPIDPEAIADAADVAFLALPHTAAMAYAPQLLDAGLRVIDLSADYRLHDPSHYETVYATPHEDPANLEHAVYGLPELFRDDLPAARLVANPGCYPTAAALGIAPLLTHALVKPDPITIVAASGTSGAGRAAKPATHFLSVNEAFGPYGTIGGHRHQPEIAQTLCRVAGKPRGDIDPLFLPHLLPIDVGILETVTLEPADEQVTQDELFEAFADAYDDEPFVRLRGTDDALPNVKHVAGTNFVDVTVRLVTTGASDKPRVAVFVAEDNLVKGASGQAIQNLNAMFGFDETLGLL